MSETCPKCGTVGLYAASNGLKAWRSCGSRHWDDGSEFEQSTKCLICELRRQLAAVTAELDRLAKVCEELESCFRRERRSTKGNIRLCGKWESDNFDDETEAIIAAIRRRK